MRAKWEPVTEHPKPSWRPNAQGLKVGFKGFAFDSVGDWQEQPEFDGFLSEA